MIKTRLKVRVITRAKNNGVIELAPKLLKVRLISPPVDGKANKALIKLLADYFGVKKSSVIIVLGSKSKDKVVEINA